MLYSEYDVKSATMVKANTLEELVKKLAGVNSQKALETITEYNNSIDEKVSLIRLLKMEDVLKA